MGFTDAAARDHARKLEAKGCLKRRVRMGKANWLYLEPLLEKLEEIPPVAEAEKEAPKPIRA